MRKKLLCLLLVLIMPVMVLAGCSNAPAEENGGYDRFKVVCYERCDIYIDKETKIMYLWVKNGYGGGLTVMLNADGTPMLWEGEL